MGLGGKGNRTAAIAVGGVTAYDGTDYSSAYYPSAPSAGFIGSYTTDGCPITCTEEWNGNSWSEVNNAIGS